MSADAKLLRLVQLNRDAERSERLGHDDNAAACQVEADALLGELSAEFRAQAARIAELTEAVDDVLTEEQLSAAGKPCALYPALQGLRAARRALTPGGE